MNTQYRKNLKAVLEASKNYTDQKINDLQWQLGTYDLSVDTNTDTAHIKQLPSGTIQTTVAKVDGVGYKVNQLVANGNFESASDNRWVVSRGTLSISNNVATVTASDNSSPSFALSRVSMKESVVGHKYLVAFDIKHNVDTSKISQIEASGGWGTFVPTTPAINTKTRCIGITTGYSVASYISIALRYNNASDMQIGVDKMEIEDVVLFDLTADFGSGNEPSTVSDCYTAYLQRGINIYEYTPQQSSIKNNAFTGATVEGFNKWDEETELGELDINGENKSSTTQIRSKNYIDVRPNITYYFRANTTYNVLIVKYDSNKSQISQDVIQTNNTFTTPSNCAYIRFHLASAYGTTYKHDICINISGSANGTYVPYVQPTTISVDLTTIKDSNNVSLFPSGKMMGNSSVADFITPYNQESRWNEVDLGSLSWTRATSGDIVLFLATLPVPSVRYTPNLLNTKYQVYTGYWSTSPDKRIGIMVDNASQIGITDSSYSDSTTFKTAMSGVKLQYERATYLTSNTDLTSLTKINAQSNGTITLNNTDNVDMPNTIKSLKEVAK